MIRLHVTDEIKNYLEVDYTILNDNSENSYKNELIYILHFPLNGEATISYGKGLIEITPYDVKHECNTENCSSGGPILDALNNKVIGIHKGYIKNKFNLGTFLKFPLKELSFHSDCHFVEYIYYDRYNYFLTVSFFGSIYPLDYISYFPSFAYKHGFCFYFR